MSSLSCECVSLEHACRYGSYAPATADVYTDNILICFINCGTSILAGFAVVRTAFLSLVCMHSSAS